MRSRGVLLLTTLALAGAPALAIGGKSRKPPKVAGTWEIQFQSIANTCRDTGYSLGAETMTVTQKGRALGAEIALLPRLKGDVDQDGKLRLGRPRGGSGIEGLNAEFQLTGAFAGDAVEIVLVARYFVGAEALCEQSWSGKGARKK